MFKADQPSRGASFFVFDRMLNAALKRGTASCSRASRRMADAITVAEPLAHVARATMPGVLATEEQWLGFLKARCGLCPFRCDNPVE